MRRCGRMVSGPSCPASTKLSVRYGASPGLRLGILSAATACPHRRQQRTPNSLFVSRWSHRSAMMIRRVGSLSRGIISSSRASCHGESKSCHLMKGLLCAGAWDLLRGMVREISRLKLDYRKSSQCFDAVRNPLERGSGRSSPVPRNYLRQAARQEGDLALDTWSD
jgi:hypothetical protein